MVEADTHYARSGDLSIAYQVWGDGPIDLVITPGIISHVEFFHKIPGYTAWLERMSRFARVIVFDKRGSGLSDRPDAIGTLEERIDDMRAVMDAVGSERAAVVGWSEGGAMSVLYAATHPDRVIRLALCGAYACFSGDPMNGAVMIPEIYEAFIASMIEQWGEGGFLSVVGPSLAADPAAAKLLGRIERQSATPRTIARPVGSRWKVRRAPAPPGDTHPHARAASQG